MSKIRGVTMPTKNKADDRISFKGNRDIWQDFMYKVKKKKEQVWEALEPMLKEYIKKN